MSECEPAASALLVAGQDFNNTCDLKAAYPDGFVDGTECKVGSRGDKWYGGYEDSVFEQNVLAAIERADAAKPFFLFW